MVKTRFNFLVLCLILIPGLFIIVVSNIFMKNLAYYEALEKKRIIIANNEAVNIFVNDHMRPEIFELIDEHDDIPDTYFKPELMSRTYARNMINEKFVEKMDRNYYIREVSLEPRSPSNLPDEEERWLFEQIKNDSEKDEIERSEIIDGNHYLRYFKEGEIVREDCLRCHGDPRDAPEGLVQQYGEDRGFDLEVGEVASAYSVIISIMIRLTLTVLDLAYFIFYLCW